MQRVKKTGVYVILAAALALLLFLAFFHFWEDCAQSAVTGKQTMQYTRVAGSADGQVYAVGRQNGVWKLVRGSGGARQKNWSLEKLGISGVLRVDQLFACADGGAVLSVYEEGEELLCRAYYLSPDGKAAQPFFNAACLADTAGETRIYGFAEQDGVLAFLVRQGEEITAYRYTPGEESAWRMEGVTAQENETALFALPEGIAVSVSEGVLSLGNEALALPEEVDVRAAWSQEDGVFILDGADGALWKLTGGSDAPERLFDLDNMADVVDLSCAAGGRVLLLTGEGDLLCWQDGTIQDQSALLYRARWQSILILALAAAGVLLAALVLWFILWDVRKMQLSLVLQKGVAIALVLVLLTLGAIRWVVTPWFEEQAAAEAGRYLSAVPLTVESMDDLLGEDWVYSSELSTRAEFIYALWRAFGSPEVPVTHAFDDVDLNSGYLMAVEWALEYNITDGIGNDRFGPDEELTAEQGFIFLYRAMRYIGGERATLVEQDGALYRSGADGEKTALSALLLGSHYRQVAIEALREGESFARYESGGVSYYARLVKTGASQLEVVSVEAEPYLEQSAQGQRTVTWILWGIAAVAWVLLLTLTTLRYRLRRIIEGMDALHGGKTHMEVVDHGGDEISALANSLTTLAGTLRSYGEEGVRRGDIYSRFLPGQLVELLGVDRVESIDKETFASRRMTTMHVSFSFEESVYESRSKELFDNINEVTERASRVVSAQRGTIFSFSHEGFDALFEADSPAAVSAAVAIRQEIIAANRERSRRSLSPVTLRIALDTGEVMLGVVGDESRMQPTAVSSSFNTTRMLTTLFSKFEANILCTEQIERLAEGYGSRYIGKTRDGAELIRVYELYDGDPYLIRQGKADTAVYFADGVYSLYAGDYAAAKRTFMEIARRNSGDGVAKFYLYLADRFEKEPPEEVCLDF